MTVSGSGILKQDEGEERHQLGHVASEDVGDELADVGVDRAPLAHRGDDRGEVVVGQDHIAAASLATSVPALPIATPMSAALSAGASLTPSPVTATTSPAAPGAPTRSRSLCSGETRANRTPGSAQERRGAPSSRERVELGAGRSRVSAPAGRSARAMALGGQAVVAGDHDDADARPAGRAPPRPRPRGAAGPSSATRPRKVSCALHRRGPRRGSFVGERPHGRRRGSADRRRPAVVVGETARRDARRSAASSGPRQRIVSQRRRVSLRRALDIGRGAGAVARDERHSLPEGIERVRGEQIVGAPSLLGIDAEPGRPRPSRCATSVGSPRSGVAWEASTAASSSSCSLGGRRALGIQLIVGERRPDDPDDSAPSCGSA